MTLKTRNKWNNPWPLTPVPNGWTTPPLPFRISTYTSTWERDTDCRSVYIWFQPVLIFTSACLFMNRIQRKEGSTFIYDKQLNCKIWATIWRAGCAQRSPSTDIKAPTNHVPLLAVFTWRSSPSKTGLFNLQLRIFTDDPEYLKKEKLLHMKSAF